MIVTLYKNSSDNIVVSKSIEELKTYTTVLLFKDSSILSPTLIFTTSDVVNANYLYITEWKRYYYITDITILDNNKAVVKCNVDVLMSFKNEILNTKQNIVRSQNRYNMYMIDDKMKVLCNKSMQTLNLKPPTGGWVLDNDLNTGNARYVLNVISGTGTI